MKTLLCLSLIMLAATILSCDLRSDTAKREMEKFSGTPTPVPSYSATPEPTPIDPADVANVDITQEGDLLFVDGHQQNKALNCTKFNPVNVNGNGSVVTIKGICRRITINGDSNQITADAAMEFIFNGTDNKLTFSKFPNGKHPIVTENMAGNTVEQVPASNSQSSRKDAAKK